MFKWSEQMKKSIKNFPKDSKKSKKLGYWTLGSGGKRAFKWNRKKWTDT